MKAHGEPAESAEFHFKTTQALNNLASRAREIFFLTVRDEFEEYQNRHTVDGVLTVGVGGLQKVPNKTRLKRRLRGLRLTFQALKDVADAYPGSVGRTVGPEHYTPEEWAVERAIEDLRQVFPEDDRRSPFVDWLASDPLSDAQSLLSGNQIGVYSVVASRILSPFRTFTEYQLRIFANALPSGPLSGSDLEAGAQKKGTSRRPHSRSSPADPRKVLIAGLKARKPRALAREICGLIDKIIEKNTFSSGGALEPLESWVSITKKRAWVENYGHKSTRNRVRGYINKVPPTKTRTEPSN